jgi:phage tail-like protein
MESNRRHPLLNCNFFLEIDGIIEAGFHECSGLEATIDVVEHREGGAPSPWKYAGTVKYANLVLKRGLATSMEIPDWFESVLAARDGDTLPRKSGSIIVFARDGVTEKARWNFRDAWPCKLTGPSLSAEASDIAIETVELAHEGLTRVRVG